MFSFPTGQTIAPAGMAIMPSSHLYGHAGLIHSAMPILATSTESSTGQLITAGIAPNPGYTAGNGYLMLVCSTQESQNTEDRFVVSSVVIIHAHFPLNYL